jgi:hypothetical protein
MNQSSSKDEDGSDPKFWWIYPVDRGSLASESLEISAYRYKIRLFNLYSFLKGIVDEINTTCHH